MTTHLWGRRAFSSKSCNKAANRPLRCRMYQPQYGYQPQYSPYGQSAALGPEGLFGRWPSHRIVLAIH